MKIKLFATLSVLLLFPIAQLAACDFEFKVLGDTKETYKIGEELIIEVQIKLTHRGCHESAEATKFKTEGFEVKGTTPWKQVTPMCYSRKVKAVVTKSEKHKSMLFAQRTCNKDGGSGSIELTVQ